MNDIPQHVAIIMDGNGRWAKQRNRPRIFGHQEGVNRVEDIIRAAQSCGIKYLTLYAFSKENWQRPKQEVAFLMGLLSSFLDSKLNELKKNNVVFNTIGRLSDMPKEIQEKILRDLEETQNNTGLVATFAFSYSSRLEITEACREIARKVSRGEIDPETISEGTVSDHLYTRNIPDPDLLIRTSGEMRVSNFLLWQISYSEFYVTEKYWPDFDAEEFKRAIETYQKRERRFGLTQPAGR